MPAATNTYIHSLSFSKSLPSEDPREIPVERVIKREDLVDIAPDREDFILEAGSIGHIREALKIRAHNRDHWLLQARTRLHTRVRDPVVRVANLIPEPVPEPVPINTRDRRSMSVTQLNHLSHEVSRKLSLQPEPTFETPTELHAAYIYNLSTTDQLISPRPLGPTHMLIAFSTEPLSGVYPKILECPINDLLFVANCPNLLPDLASGKKLPHRLPKDLPRVLLRVKNLETFGPLVVYLHTKNQAALFRALVPEWIRDLVHPLPILFKSAAAAATSPVLLSSLSSSSRSINGASSSRGRTARCLRRNGSPDSDLTIVTSLPTQTAARTVESVATDLINIEGQVPYAARRDDLSTTYGRLNKLKGNLDLLGYYGREVWIELDGMREVVGKALSEKKRVKSESSDKKDGAQASASG